MENNIADSVSTSTGNKYTGHKKHIIKGKAWLIIFFFLHATILFGYYFAFCRQEIADNTASIQNEVEEKMKEVVVKIQSGGDLKSTVIYSNKDSEYNIYIYNTAGVCIDQSKAEKKIQTKITATTHANFKEDQYIVEVFAALGPASMAKISAWPRLAVVELMLAIVSTIIWLIYALATNTLPDFSNEENKDKKEKEKEKQKEKERINAKQAVAIFSTKDKEEEINPKSTPLKKEEHVEEKIEKTYVDIGIESSEAPVEVAKKVENSWQDINVQSKNAPVYKVEETNMQPYSKESSWSEHAGSERKTNTYAEISKEEYAPLAGKAMSLEDMLNMRKEVEEKKEVEKVEEKQQVKQEKQEISQPKLQDVEAFLLEKVRNSLNVKEEKVENIAQKVQSAYAAKLGNVAVKTECNGATVKADINKLAEAVGSCIMSTEKANITDADLKINVEIKETNEKIIIEISDNEKINTDVGSIFTATYTEDKKIKDLKLSKCKNIITCHSGKVWAEKNNSGGKTVYLSLDRSIPETAKETEGEINETNKFKRN
ncbi:MAG: ATP-binding protein [Clostridia bacterium]